MRKTSSQPISFQPQPIYPSDRDKAVDANAFCLNKTREHAAEQHKAPINGRGFGLLQCTDFSDYRYPAKLALRRMAAAAPVRTSKLWRAGAVLDQGDTPQCVAYSACGLLEAGPILNKKHPAPQEIYDLAQSLDEWPGNDYDGTSVRAGMKALQQLGFLNTYVWANGDIETITQWLLSIGPVVFGTVWADSMMEPFQYRNASWAVIEGNYVDGGGHAYMIDGVDIRKRCPDGSTGAYRIRNSWGRGWGDNGNVWISILHATMLAKEAGECCMPTEILRVAA